MWMDLNNKKVIIFHRLMGAVETKEIKHNFTLFLQNQAIKIKKIHFFLFKK